MVTLLYGIAIGIVLTVTDLISICVGSIIVGVCIAFAYYETRIMRGVRKFEKETIELDKAIRKTWHNIEDELERRSAFKYKEDKGFLQGGYTGNLGANSYLKDRLN